MNKEKPQPLQRSGLSNFSQASWDERYSTSKERNDEIYFPMKT